MKKFMEKVKNDKLRSACIGLSAFLFGFIAVSVFNNIGDTYAISYTCPTGYNLFQNAYCCPTDYYYTGDSKCTWEQKINDDGSCPRGSYKENNSCKVNAKIPTELQEDKCYLCGGSQNGSYKWGKYANDSSCSLMSQYNVSTCPVNKNYAWTFYPNATTSGTYGATWTGYGSGYYQGNGSVVISCSGGSCTNRVTSLPTITRTGYKFAGWSPSSSCSGTASFRTPMSIVKNLTYYACWQAVDGCYSMNSHYMWGKYGGSTFNYHADYTTESACLANNSDPAPSQNPGDFTGGGSSSGGSSSEEPEPDVIAGTIQYYKITYDLDGGKLIDGKTSKTQYVRGDKAVGTPKTNPIKNGYSFVQWEYNGSKFDFNTKLDDIKSGLTTITESNVTVYTLTLKATYTELDYSDMECPSGTVLDPSIRKCYSILNDSSYPSYTLSTYSAKTRFCYAYNNSQGKPGGIAFHSVAEDDCPADGITGTGSEGYCKIEGKNNKTSGKYSDYSNSDAWMSQNSCFIASPCTSAITDSSACTIRWDTIIYNVSDAKINEVTLPEEPVEIPETYTVTYDANGGSGAPSSQTKTENIDLTLSSTKPTKEGYTFVNWNTKKDGTGTSYDAGAVYSGNANITLYAQYQKKLIEGEKKYTVTFWMNDGTNSKEEKVINDGDKVVKPADPVRDGYVFNGWYDKKEKGTKYDFTKDVVSDIDLYAHWEKASTYDKTDDELTNNGKTGDILIFVAWVVGIGALAYSVYYFKLKKENV